MHGRRDRILTDFETVLAQYEPMISATLRNLNIYRDREGFRQVGRVALWQAWMRYEKDQGHFAPYASLSIRGAMLDKLKEEGKFEEHNTQTEDEILDSLRDGEVPEVEAWSDRLTAAFDQLTENERTLIQWLFVENRSQAEAANIAGISVAGIKKRRARMLIKLRTLIDRLE